MVKNKKQTYSEGKPSVRPIQTLQPPLNLDFVWFLFYCTRGALQKVMLEG